ncbi:MAG: MFS transporter [Spirochaetales bacterium]|nr:MFS transporter [Spirochaetales bacterium]
MPVPAIKNSTYAWLIVLLGLITITGALGFARFGYTSLLSAMKQGLGLNEAQTGDLAAANMLGYLFLAISCGFIASRFGPRIVIGISMLVVALAMFLTGVAESYTGAILGRLFAGMGSGGANVPVMGLLAAWFTSKRRGLAAGIVVSGSSVGLLVTGLVIPSLLERYPANGWRYAWYLLAGIVLFIAVLCLLFFRNRPADDNENPAVPEARPALNWSLVYRNPAVWKIGLVYALFGFSYIIFMTFFSRYLVAEGGFSEQSAGRLLALTGGFSIASGFIWGTVSDKLGRKYGLALVFFLQAACYLVFGLWKALPGYILSAVLFALTAWSIPAIMSATVGDTIGARLAPAALGFITLFFGTGQVLGPFAAGRIAQASGSYAPAFITAGITALLGAGLSLIIGTGRPSRRTIIHHNHL